MISPEYLKGKNMLIIIDFESVVCSGFLYQDEKLEAVLKPGIIDFINSVKESYEIQIYLRNFRTAAELDAVRNFLDESEVPYDAVTTNVNNADIFISKNVLKFDGDFTNLKYSLLRYRENEDPKHVLSPGDYGKLYYRLSLLPKGTITAALRKYGYTPIIKNKLVLVEFALNVLPIEAWYLIWKKEFRTTGRSDHALFIEAWNTTKQKENERNKIYDL